MQITRTSIWDITLKLKSTEVAIGSEGIKINAVVIKGPGEYDVAGVSVAGLQVRDQILFVLRAEDMHICVIPRQSVELSSSDLEQIGSVDIVVAPLVADRPPSDTLTMINSLEPQMVVLTGDGDVSSFVKADAPALGNSIKVAKATLSPDSRDFVVLSLAR